MGQQPSYKCSQLSCARADARQARASPPVVVVSRGDLAAVQQIERLTAQLASYRKGKIVKQLKEQIEALIEENEKLQAAFNTLISAQVT